MVKKMWKKPSIEILDVKQTMKYTGGGDYDWHKDKKDYWDWWKDLICPPTTPGDS